jgi:hypothetical protein
VRSCVFYILTSSRSWAFLEKPPVAQLLKNFPAFYGTRRFITVFTLVPILSQNNTVHTTPSCKRTEIRPVRTARSNDDFDICKYCNILQHVTSLGICLKFMVKKREGNTNRICFQVPRELLYALYVIYTGSALLWPGIVRTDAGTSRVKITPVNYIH